MPTRYPTYAPAVCPNACIERDNGPVFCPDTSLLCLNGGYYSKTNTCEQTLEQQCYNENIPDYKFYMDDKEKCICPPNYSGVDCRYPNKAACALLEDTPYFDNSFVDTGQGDKILHCTVEPGGIATLLALKSHRLEITLKEGGKTLSLKFWSRGQITPSKCSRVAPRLQCDATNCDVGTDAATGLPLIQCRSVVCDKCNKGNYRYHEVYQNEPLCGSLEPYIQQLNKASTQNNNEKVILFLAMAEAVDKAGEEAELRAAEVFMPILSSLKVNCKTSRCLKDPSNGTTTISKGAVLDPSAPAVRLAPGAVSRALIIVFMVVGILLVVAFAVRERRMRSRQLEQLAGRSKQDAVEMEDMEESAVEVEGLEESAVEVEEMEESAVVVESFKNLTDAQRLEQPGFGLVWKDVAYTINTRGGERTILNNVNGYCLPGEMVAILGPSGAGKTTLLNILADRRGGSTGSVQLVGRGSQALQRRDVLSYVQQYDSLLATQTVRECLVFSAMLRIKDAGTKIDEINADITLLLQRLRIGHITDSRIGSHDTGGISGGERKRVDIGVELITKPGLLLLDEPTSGLDSTNVELLLDALHQVARNGCCCLFTIHQVPGRFFTRFDKVILMMRTGEVGFHGTPTDAVAHSKRLMSKETFYNPAEFMLEFASVRSDDSMTSFIEDFNGGAGAQVQEGLQAALVHPVNSEPCDVVRAAERPLRPCHAQFYYVFKRALQHFSRSLSLFFMTMGVTVCLSVFLGFVFWQLDNRIPGAQNRFGIMFFLCVYFSLTSLSSLGKFVNNQHMYKREMASGYYSLLNFYMSEFLVDLIPLRVLPPVLLSAICYGMVGLQDVSGRFETFLFLLILINMVATALCMAVSAGASSIGQANFIAVLINIVSLVYGGLILSNESETALSQIKVLSFYHYAYEALCVNEFHGLVGYFNPKGFDINLELKGDVYLDNWGMSYENLSTDVVVLLVFFLVFTALGFVLLWLDNTRRPFCQCRFPKLSASLAELPASFAKFRASRSKARAAKLRASLSKASAAEVELAVTSQSSARLAHAD